MQVPISILMTTYNCSHLIKDSINSVLLQSYKNYELVIIDDGSEDNTESIVNKFNDNRIRYIKIVHSGRSAALNYGLKEAKNEWVALIDSDDLWRQDKLKKQIDLFSFHQKSISIINVCYFLKNKVKYFVNYSGESIKQILALHGHISGSTALFNKNQILINGGYNSNLNNAEDYDLWLRLKDNFKFEVIPEYLVYLRIRMESLSRKNLQQRNQIIYLIQEKYYSNLEKEFDIKGINQTIIRGWREFFYGDKNMSRKYWLRLGFNIICKPKILTAIFISFFPEKVYRLFVESRFKYRIKRLARFNKPIHNELNILLSSDVNK